MPSPASHLEPLGEPGVGGLELLEDLGVAVIEAPLDGVGPGGGELLEVCDAGHGPQRRGRGGGRVAAEGG